MIENIINFLYNLTLLPYIKGLALIEGFSNSDIYFLGHATNEYLLKEYIDIITYKIISTIFLLPIIFYLLKYLTLKLEINFNIKTRIFITILSSLAIGEFFIFILLYFLTFLVYNKIFNYTVMIRSYYLYFLIVVTSEIFFYIDTKKEILNYLNEVFKFI
ncbi:hypothetical protein CFT13S00388_02455 [Campylobacter fetus subsp. testudinum]|uniref:hypothetical protein n=1 Tax=Campylobacter fetus TaxID=196 RepID=UPI000818C8E2|nr:hypothetical protein [Campylobacter fetus]OCR88049.1 hypothetical protein CFT13S00388_02455 [Campylobacter fetus subsp. testudinum]